MLASLALPLFLAPMALAAVLPRAVPDVQKEFTGRGQIHVLNFTSFVIESPQEGRIGCLNELGLLTLEDCAVFTVKDDFPKRLSSSRGSECTFFDRNMPNNKDSYYGRDTYAWSCRGSDLSDRYDERYYTVNGFSYPFICNGNLGCTYDIPATPSPEQRPQPVWQFFWGSHQMGITPGHTQVLWVWIPVGKAE